MEKENIGVVLLKLSFYDPEIRKSLIEKSLIGTTGMFFLSLAKKKQSGVHSDRKGGSEKGPSLFTKLLFSPKFYAGYKWNFA